MQTLVQADKSRRQVPNKKRFNFAPLSHCYTEYFPFSCLLPCLSGHLLRLQGIQIALLLDFC